MREFAKEPKKGMRQTALKSFGFSAGKVAQIMCFPFLFCTSFVKGSVQQIRGDALSPDDMLGNNLNFLKGFVSLWVKKRKKDCRARK